MKRDGMILLAVLSGLAVATTAPAITDGSNPYGRIVDRNIFSLKPPAPTVAPEPPPPPAPEIKLQGTTSILGRRQVLFKVKPAKAGEKEESYVLSEGQREGEIEVLAIDEKAGTIKFNNHGAIQTLSMDKDAVAPPTTTVAAAAGAIPRPTPGMPRPGGVGQTAGGGSAANAGQQGLRSIPTRPTRGANNNTATPTLSGGNLTVGGITTGGGTTQPSKPTHPPLSREEQTIIIEIERERTRADVAAGALPPLPPTELTPPGSTGIPDEAIPAIPE